MSTPSFKYTADWQNELLACVLQHPAEFEQYMPVFEYGNFTGYASQVVARVITELWKEYGTIPSLTALADNRSFKDKSDLQKECADYVRKLSTTETHDCAALPGPVPRLQEDSKAPYFHLCLLREGGLGGIGILVNNAGISRPQDVTEITEKDWDAVLTVNLKSMFLVTQAVRRGMRKRGWGRIINLSGSAQTGGVIGPHYAASKAGVIGLTHSFAALT